MKSFLTLSFLFSFFAFNVTAQDTFSIVAADSTSRVVGSAGASCVDLFNTGFLDDSFLGDLLPDTGAINTQAFYLAGNQNNARLRMRAGDNPGEIITWLANNDVQDNSSTRQYGIVGFTGDQVSAAGFTGSNTNDYKNHISGSINGIYYSIQGNILLGQQILDSMESKFRNAEGDIACRLMAALQGANVTGADTRCDPNGTSSLFAFLKITNPNDMYGSPTFSISVRTHGGAGIEPVDSLQSIFDFQYTCGITNTSEITDDLEFSIHPNPAQDDIKLKVDPSFIGKAYIIFDLNGREISKGVISSMETSIEVRSFEPGLYVIKAENLYNAKFIKK